MKPFSLSLIVGGMTAVTALTSGIACKNIGFPTAVAAAQAPTAPDGSEYRRLQDIVQFEGTLAGQAATADGGATLDTQNGGLPLDGTQKHDGKDVARLRVSGSGGNWLVKVARGWWLNSDSTQYVPHGVVTLIVKGAAGGETFAVGMNDMNGHESLYSSDFAVTTDWQTIRVPLSALLPANTAFHPEKLQTINLKAVGTAKPQTVYIADIRITSPDAELAAAPVKVNQLGFSPSEPKRALVSGFAEELRADEGTEFTVKNAQTGTAALNGTLKLVTEDDPEISGEKILSADFSTLRTPGQYVVSVAGVGDSVPFTIGTGIYEPLVQDTARYFYFQRSGMALDAAHAGSSPVVLVIRRIKHLRSNQTRMGSNAMFPAAGTMRATMASTYRCVLRRCRT